MMFVNSNVASYIFLIVNLRKTSNVFLIKRLMFLQDQKRFNFGTIYFNNFNILNIVKFDKKLIFQFVYDHQEHRNHLRTYTCI